MKCSTLAFGVGIVFVCSAASAHRSSRVHEDIDPQTKLRTLTLEVRTSSCQAPTTADWNNAQVRVLFNASQLPTGGADYVVVVDLRGGQFIRPGRRGVMETLTDGAQDQLHLIDKANRWRDHPWYGGREKREMIPFGADHAWFEEVANTRVLQFRVDGASRPLERCTDAKELHDLQEFLSRAATF